MPELALGTAKIGLKTYGVGSTVVMTDSDGAVVINTAAKLGIPWADTAQAYGNAEDMLDSTYRAPGHFKVITKILPHAACHQDHAAKLMAILTDHSLRQLSRWPDVILLHTQSQIMDKSIVNALMSSREDARWGISAYNPSYAMVALNKGATAIEFPLHMLNQSFLPVAKMAKDAGCLTIARSPFACGALLRDPATISPSWRGPVKDVQEYAGHLGISVAKLAFLWAWQQPHIDVLVVGVSSAAQLREIHGWSRDHTWHIEGYPALEPPLETRSLWAT